MCFLSVYPQASVFPVNKSVNESERAVYFLDFSLSSISESHCKINFGERGMFLKYLQCLNLCFP